MANADRPHGSGPVVTRGPATRPTEDQKLLQRRVSADFQGTDTWRALPGLPIARGGLAAVALDGACHVIGGEDWALAPPGTYGTHDVLEPGATAWRTLAPMPTARHGLGLASLGGVILAVGGGPSQGNSYTAAVEVFRR